MMLQHTIRHARVAVCGLCELTAVRQAPPALAQLPVSCAALSIPAAIWRWSSSMLRCVVSSALGRPAEGAPAAASPRAPGPRHRAPAAALPDCRCSPPEKAGGEPSPWAVARSRRRWLAHVAGERLQKPGLRRCRRRRCRRRCRAAIAASSRQEGSSGRSGGRRRRGRATCAASAAQAASASVSAAEAASVTATAEESRSGRGDVAEVEVDGRRVAREGDDLVAGHGRCGRLLALVDGGSPPRLPVRRRRATPKRRPR